jgi:hypothetical protein
MKRIRDLPLPVDLPPGTKAIAKVQRPPDGRGEDLHWMAFARGPKHLRLYKRDTLPTWLVEAIGPRSKAYFHAKIHDGEWVFLSIADGQSW